MRWVIAARVSTADKGQDPATQVDALVARAKREGAEVVATVIDHRSAWSDKAAEAWEKKVLDAVVAHQADVLAVWAMDRLTRRDAEHALGLIGRLEKHHRVQFFSLQEPFLSTATADPNLRGLLMPLFVWVANRESGRRSERLTAKAEAKRNRANAVGQRARWGRGVMATDQDVVAVWSVRDEKLGRGGAPTSVRAIAERLGLSKSAVDRILRAGRPVPAEPLGHDDAPRVEDAPSDLGGLGQ